MPHTHKLQDGRETGPEIIDPDNIRKHWHMLEGERTSSEDFGPGHTHTIDGAITGPPIEPEGDKAMPDKREFKFCSGEIKAYKQEDRPEGNFGIVEGYIATFDVDRGDFFGVKDQFVPGAFVESISDHARKNRSVRLLSHHDKIIGQFPIVNVREDERGLFARGEINLDVQEGREIYSLVRQGAISDFSIGFSIAENGSIVEGDLRTITKATIWEGSLVDEPMNPHANVTDIKKSVVPFQDLFLAERKLEWDPSAALQRVKEFTDSEDIPSAGYRRAFLWFDKENINVFSGYKLHIADVINGRLTVIPQGVFAAAAVVKENTNLPDADRPGVIRHLERYYAKMDLESPFGGDEDGKQFLTTDDVRNMSVRDLEKFLKDTERLSKNAAKYLASLLTKKPELDNDPEPVHNQKDLKQIIAEINGIKDTLK